MGYIETGGWWRKSSGYWTLYAPSLTTTDDLKLMGNTTDTFSYIRIEGNGDIYGAVPTNSHFYFSGGANTYLDINGSATQLTLSTFDNNKDLYLAPHGTGVVKFGTHTASGDLATNGYITIKDSGGTSRRLATVP